MTPEDRLRRMIEAARENGDSPDEWHEFAGRAHRALFLRQAAIATGALALVAVGAFSAMAVVGEGAENPDPVAPASTPSRSPNATKSPPADASPSPPESSPTPAPPAAIQQFPGEIWLVGDERLFFGWTFVPYTDEPGEVSATKPPGSAVQRAAVVLEALLDGPTASDVEAGATTAIPDGSRLLDVDILEDTSGKASIATIDLSGEFESGGGSLSMQLRVAQVVYTATQVEGVDAARIAIDGRIAETLGGEGLMIDSPMDRSDFGDLAPPIVLDSPKIDSALRGPVVVSGYANVFEANVNIQILDQNGKVLTETFATATCGSGCRGRFTKTLRFSVDEEQDGRVEVLTYSAEDGSPQDVISVPVTLRP